MASFNEIRNSFNKHAGSYEALAKVQHEIEQRLLERLQYIKMKPQRILDLGCGVGRGSHALTTLYPKAHVIGLDCAETMLFEARKKQSWRRSWSLVGGDMSHLPFADGTFDLIFANQVVHWSGDYFALFQELHRVLTADGCFMFTTLGPDTFIELKAAWQSVHEYAHVNDFLDMHDVGDLLMRARFLDPVMDMERLSIQYATMKGLVESLRGQGVRNINPLRAHGLLGKGVWQTFVTQYERFKTEAGKYPLSYELVFGHAWKGQQAVRGKGVEVRIPVTQIRKKASVAEA